MNPLINIVLENSDYCGYLVIDSVIRDTSSGGVRIAGDIMPEEVRILAREMTLKYSFIGLPKGGAKSGVKIPKDTNRKEVTKILEDFGRRIGPLIRRGIYYPGMDMNCGPEDLRAIYRGAGITRGKITDTSYFTAISVINAIYACREAFEIGDRSLTIAIEGFGSVGSYLSERLPRDKYKIIAVSTVKGAVINEDGYPTEMLLENRKRFGDNFVNRITDGRLIAKEDLLSSDVDILVPSARTWVINEKNVKDIKARFIVPISNAPYREDVIDFLQQRGVICLPGFVTNSGGVYASSLFDRGVSIKAIEDISNTYYRQAIVNLLLKSNEMRQSPVKVAEKVAYKRLQDRGYNADVFYKRLFKICLQKGIIPKGIYGKFILKDFVENLTRLLKEVQYFSPY